MIFLALRNLAARPRRTLLTALAVIVGVAMVSGALVLTDSMNSTVDELFESGQAQVDVVVTPRSRDNMGGDGNPATPTIAADVLQRARDTDGVRQAVGETFAIVQMLKRDSDDAITVGPPSFVASISPPAFTQFRIAQGRWPTGAGEVALERLTAERGGYRVGDALRIIETTGLQRLKITGIARYGDAPLGGAAVALATPEEAQRISGNGGRYDSISVVGDPGTDPATLSASLQQALSGDPVIVRTADQQAKSQASDLKDALGFLQPVLLAFAGIALFVGGFVIVNSFAATLAQRSQELAMLRTLGATRGQLQRSVQLEAGITGLIAGVIGLGAGLLVAPGILALFKGFGIDLPTQGTVVKPQTVVVSLVLGVGVTMIAAWRPVRRATSVPPIQAMRGLDRAQAAAEQRPGPGAFAVAAVAIAAIIASLLVSDGTAAAIALAVGALATFLSVAMLAPIVLGPLMRVLGLVAARRGPAGELARLNAMREPRRTATTAGALMVGVALVTFVAVFAAGISGLVRDTFGQRVKAPLALSDTGFQGFSAKAQDVVRADPGVERVVGVTYRGYDLKQDGSSTMAAGVDPGLASVYRLDWVDGDDTVLDRLGKDGVVVDTESDNPVLVKAKVGDRFTLLDASSSPVEVVVRGRVKEGNTLVGGGLLASRAFVQGTSAREMVSLSFVAVRPGTQVSAVQKRLRAALTAEYPTVRALTSTELENQFVGQVNQLVNMIYAFLAFALIVSLLGISTTFGLVVQERRRELGILRAVGMTRRQIRALIRWEAILTGLVGAVLGIAIGVSFAALAVHLLGEDGIGFVVPYGTLLIVLVLAAAVAALAAGRPARRAGKVDVVSVLTTD